MLRRARSSSIVVDKEVFNGEGRGGRSFLRGRFTSKNRVFRRVAELRRTVNVNLIKDLRVPDADKNVPLMEKGEGAKNAEMSFL
jgi:hypothetical protein